MDKFLGITMGVAADIERKLTEVFQPVALDVIDQSHLHAGHAESSDQGETHFRIRIVSTAFETMSRVQRQRKLNEILAAELEGSVHALSAQMLTPEEANR